MNTTHIYTLAHPETNVIRYVGKANNLRARLALHVRKNEHTAKSRWIQSLQAKGLAPKMEVIDVVPCAEWQFWEMYWIAQIKAWGHTLYNGDNGGLGTDRLPEAVKNRISDTLRGRPQPQKWVPYNQYTLAGELVASHASAAQAALAVNGGHPNIIRSSKDGQQAYGFIWTKGASAAANIPTRYDSNGRTVVSAETRAKLSKASTGRIHPPRTDETRAKMRAARLGVTPANKGIPQTEAQRTRNRDSCPTKRAVCQYSEDGLFVKKWGSIKEAALALGVNRIGITKSINGISLHAGRFKWAPS